MKAKKPKIDPRNISILPFSAGYDTKSFSCGYTKIDNYLQNSCCTDHNNYETRSAVAFKRGVSHPIGFYTLCLREESASLFLTHKSYADRFFKAQSIITAHVKWAGVDTKHQREGIGSLMFGNALDDFYNVATKTGLFVLTLDAISDDAVAFYKKLGFQNTEGYARKLHLPIEEIIASRKKLGLV